MFAGSKPYPLFLGEWSTERRVRPYILETNLGYCISQAQGPPGRQGALGAASAASYAWPGCADDHHRGRSRRGLCLYRSAQHYRWPWLSRTSIEQLQAEHVGAFCQLEA